MPDEKVLRPALYMRVSTDIQARKEEGSLDTQEEMLRRVLGIGHRRYGEPLLFREEGASGKSLDRPEMQRLIAAVRAGLVDVVMVTRLDRLTRSIVDFFELHRVLEKHGAELICLNESFDTTTAMGRAMLKLVLVFAELEREQTAERTRASMRARAERGLWNGGPPPLGYDSAEGGHLIVNEEEARLVRLAFDKYCEFRSAPKVAKWLTEQGYRQKRYRSRRKGATGGQVFSTASVRHMVRNPLYLGMINQHDRVFPGQHDAIVDKEVFDRVQALMDGNRKQRRAPPLRARYDYLLTGLVQDAEGNALTTSAGTGRNGTTYFYYRNVARMKYPEEKRQINQIAAPRLEKVVLSLVRKAAQTPEIVEQAIREANALAATEIQPLRDQRDSLKRELDQVEQQGRDLMARLLAMDLGSSSFVKDAMADLEQRRTQLRSSLAQAEAELAVRSVEQLDMEVAIEAIRGVDVAFANLETAEKRELLGLLIQTIIVHPTRVEVHFFDGRAASAHLSGKKGQNDETAGVDQRFVTDEEWLPHLDSNQGHVD